MLWPGDDPPADLVNLISSARPQIISVLQAERGRINRWIVSQLIDWPPELLPALPQADHHRTDVDRHLERRGCGALSSALSRRVVARQEVAARKALGMKETSKC